MSVTAERITWDEVLARDDLVGGQLEIKESPHTTRGSIAEVVRRGATIRFRAEWSAHEVIPGR